MHGAAQWASLSAWFAGRCVVLWTENRLDPDAIWQLASDEQVSGMQVVGDAMARPLADTLAADPHRFDLKRLRMIGSGGAILSDGVKETLRSVLPDLQIADSFGSSESGSQGHLVGRGGEGSPRFAMNENTSVLDDALRPVAPGSGQRGRLARSGHIPLGYYKDAKKTAETFPTDASGRRWVVPGDWATVESDGTITVLGRGSVSINTGGEKVFPEEVELAIRSHRDVADAVVVGVPDPRFGERVAAVVQPRPGTRPTLEQLAEHARARVAGYKIPRQIHLVDEIVRSPSGKPDYRWAKRVARGES
jgi:fatty-acyl-CoA synthase